MGHIICFYLAICTQIILLKMCGVLGWSWVVVLTPVLVPAGLWSGAFVYLEIYKKNSKSSKSDQVSV